MPTADELAAFIADCNRRRHGRQRFQDATHAAALRTIHNSTEEMEMELPRYEVRTIDADPTSGPRDYWKNPPEPVYYVQDTVKNRHVPLSSCHDKAAAEEHCARLNAREANS